MLFTFVICILLFQVRRKVNGGSLRNKMKNIIVFLRAWSNSAVRYLRTHAPSDESYQPVHSHRLISSFTARILDSHEYNVSSCGQRRLGSDCADGQADLSLQWARISNDMFFTLRLDHVYTLIAHLNLYYTSNISTNHFWVDCLQSNQSIHYQNFLVV